ncbi:hypothetical protein FPOAC2_00182 [Fusarium poae]|uniref:hypothetical protein n=1 Tax=Fusarium poae TaxID=36050 RepID=UPI001CE79B3F|nr:hypothetical protein FPOAC1_000159 [Fusarium poae]KAG8674196.1 hypothetical protein FPOAC1_000159 [Fusarium poae]
MLRRNSSRNTNRRPLSRSKSTASVVRSPIRDLESIDPVKAERDANLAAVLSYYRAEDRADEKAKKSSLTRRYLGTLQPPGDECHNHQENVVSMFTSYQKVRKSRSMMTPSHHASDMRPRSSPLPPASNDERLKDARPKSAALRAATSMSFLRSRRKTAVSRVSHVEVSDAHVEVSDAALRLARQRFQQIQEEEAKKESTLSRPKTRESQRSTTLRKSLRNISNNSTAFSFSTNSAHVSKQHGIRDTARKVSHGLRSKLRGLFGKGKSEDSEQQEHDQCATERDSDEESCLHVGDTETTEEASMFQVTAHVPSLHDVPSNKKLRSRKGSVESFADGDHCVSDDRSRVTSWTNTVTSQGTIGERQRLSIIKENGAHATENDFKRWPQSTIRCVQPNDDVCKDHERQSSISSSVTEVPDKDSYATEMTSGQGHTWDWSDDKPEHTGAQLNELDPHKTISHRSSAFFGSPSRQSFRSPSPYRRALREMNSSEEINGGLLGSQYLHSLSTLNLPARQYSNPGSEKDFYATDVDSVYSFSADDATPVPPAVGSNVLEQSPGRRYTRQPSPEITIYAPAHEHQRDTSTASSVEWKTWLSSKVSKIEGPSTPTRRMQENGALPPLGHLRELASMGSTPELSVSTAKCTPNRSPLGSVKGNAQAFPDSNSPTRRQVGIGYDENLAPNHEEKMTPSIPRRSILRAVPSLPSVATRGNLMETGSGRELQRMKSMNTIGRSNLTPEDSKRRSRTRVAGWQGSPTRSSPGRRHR